MENKLANPAPLGLMGFGMTTVLLNLHNAGLFAVGSVILSMGIFYGGIAQIIAGIMEFKQGNTFGATAFTSYGLFWLSLVFIFIWNVKEAAVPMAAYLLAWGVFTMFMYFGTLKKNKALQVIFLSLTILFFLLGIGKLTGNSTITMIAGIEGIFCGLSAIYLAMAEVLNESFGKVVMPIGAPKK